MEIRHASAPPVLTLGGIAWPYGPVRVLARCEPRDAADLDAHRCLLRDELSGRQLLVDPSQELLSSLHEGALAAGAAALRAAAPADPLTLLVQEVPWPGGAAGLEAAVSAALGGGVAADLLLRPELKAAISGLPVRLSDGAALEVSPEHLLLLDSRLLMWSEHEVDWSPADEEGEPPELEPLDPSDPLAFVTGASGQGLGDTSRTGRERPWREREVLAKLAEAGLRARWTLGSRDRRRFSLGLADPTRLDWLRDTLREHQLTPHDLTIQVVSGLQLDDPQESSA